MSPAPRIFELRISFIWTETLPTLLTGSAQKAAMSFLGNQHDYQNEYEKIKQFMTALETQTNQQNEELDSLFSDHPKTLAVKRHGLNLAFQEKLNNPCVLTPPWPWLGRNYIHYFWQYYLENVEPNNLSGDQAWEFLVPLRTNIPVKIGSPWPPNGPKCRCMVDGLLYPHGVAVVLMPRLLFKQQTDTDDPSPSGVELGAGLSRMMDRALEMRKNLTFPVKQGDGKGENLKLDALGPVLLNYMRERALHEGASQGIRLGEPLTIATVIQGSGWDANLPITPASDLHKVLEGLCSWKDDWALQQKLKPPSDTNLLLSSSTPGHIVYHLARGRAVWMPKYFASQLSRDRHKLSCYHRNLTLVSVQTEMLAQANVLYTNYLDRGEAPPPVLRSLAKFAAIRLGYLYAAQKKGGKKYTYHSASPRFYLEENDYVDLINRACDSFKMPHLAYKPH